MGEARLKMGLPPAYQIAYISGNSEERVYAQEELRAQSDDIAIAYQVRQLDEHTVRKIGESKPQAIVYTTGTESTATKNLFSHISMLRGYMPDTPILVRTELEEDDPAVVWLIDEGIHVLDDRLEFHHMVDAVEKIREGEHVALFVRSEEQLERYNYWQNVFAKENESASLVKGFVDPEFSKNGHGPERY